jgi:hypothetical protein
MQAKLLLVAATVCVALLAAGAVAGSSSAALTLDRGRAYNNVPTYFQGTDRSNWKNEWLVCASSTMRELAQDPDVHLSLRTIRTWLSVSPQYTARKLAYVIELRTNLDDNGQVEAAPLDGCRNGILYRYYHASRFK